MRNASECRHAASLLQGEVRKSGIKVAVDPLFVPASGKIRWKIIDGECHILAVDIDLKDAIDRLP